MNYGIHITGTAERDLAGAADYIEFTLKNPSAADHFLDLAEERISMLAFAPEAYAVVDDPVLSAWGIRFIVVNNYLVFFTIKDQTVYILRVLYGKRDWISILKQSFTDEQQVP